MEQPQTVDRPEPHVVRQRDGEHPRALASPVPGQLADRSDQWLVVHAARWRDQDQTVHALGHRVRHLESDGAAHRVPDQHGLVDVEGVQDRHQRLGQSGNAQDVVAALAAPVPRQVRDHIDPPLGEPACRGHEVLAGDREPVDVDDRNAVPTRAAPAVDGQSVDLQALRHPTGVGSAHGDSAFRNTDVSCPPSVRAPTRGINAPTSLPLRPLGTRVKVTCTSVPPAAGERS